MSRNLDNSTLTFPLDNDIKFIEDTHRYIYKDGTDFMPVSRVYSQFFEEFDSAHWAKLKAIKLRRNEMDLADEWKCKGEEASLHGKFMHRQIELFINGEKDIETECDFEYKSWYRDISTKLSIECEFNYFLNFINSNKINPFRTEWIVIDPNLRIAGTIDLVCRNNDNEVEIYDWKRSKALIDEYGYEIRFNRNNKHGINGLEHISDTAYWHYTIQQNLYRYILEHNYGLRVKAMHLVVLHPSLDDYRIINVQTMDNTVKTILDRFTHSNSL
ncbi:MAG: hypothetical protein IK092_05885 [Muribaculaceae bacterium]|nr:hypothetical protein [Muribaculaceae bacterium]